MPQALRQSSSPQSARVALALEALLAHTTRFTFAGSLGGAAAMLEGAIQGLSEATPSDDRPARLVEGRWGKGPAARAFKLFIPRRPTGSARRALVVMLHGCSQDPDDFAIGTAMNEWADLHDVFVLYPAQSRQANRQGCWNWFDTGHQSRDEGEPAILAAMTRQVVADHGLDASRVYVAGLSAGGAMAAILGQEYPDIFAAVGVHSGVAPGAAQGLAGALAAMNGRPGTSDPLRVPTIIFHGDADATVHACNGQSLFDAGLGQPGTLQREIVEPRGSRAATRQRRSTDDRQVMTEHWIVHGAEHAWCGGQEARSCTDPLGPDASAEMLRFFLTHRLATRRVQAGE